MATKTARIVRIVFGCALAGAVTLGAAPALAQQTAQTRTAQPGASAPPVIVTPRSFDFGNADPRKIIDTRFRVTNRGADTLFIRSIRPACNCTVPTPETKVIPPGETITIDATLDLRGHLGDAKKSFNIFFEGYGAPVKCEIKGYLTYPVKIDPPRPIMSPRRGSVQLESMDGRPFRVIAVNGEKPMPSPTQPAAVSKTMHTLAYDFSDQRIPPAMLVIETDHPEARLIDARPRGVPSIVGRDRLKNHREYFIQTNNVNAGMLGPGESAEFEVSMLRPAERHGDPVTLSFSSELDGVEMNPEDLSVEVVGLRKVDGSAKEQIITVRLTHTGSSDRLLLEKLYVKDAQYDWPFLIIARLLPEPASSGAG